MPLPIKHRSRSLQRRQVVRWKASLPQVEPTRWDPAAVGLAALLTIIFHAGLAVYGPLCFLKKSSEVFSIELAPPESEIFIETNPAAKIASPPDTPFFSSQNQRAAQPDPDSIANTPFPHQSEGELDSHKIVHGGETTAQPQDHSPATESQQDEAKSPTENIEISSDASIEQAPVRPQPQSRPQIASTSVHGPLKKTDGSTQDVGLRAVDARFTQYGEYIQRLMEVISTQYSLLYRETFRMIPDHKTYAMIAFDLNSQGQIVDLRIEKSTASQPALLLAKDAILSNAPYGPWTADMVKTLGDTQTLKIHFLYP